MSKNLSKIETNLVVTPHAQRERGKVIGRGVHIIGERAKRARHSLVCSIENRGYIYYWRASEASETLSGLFNRESYIYYILYIMVRAIFVLITRKEGGA